MIKFASGAITVAVGLTILATQAGSREVQPAYGWDCSPTPEQHRTVTSTPHRRYSTKTPTPPVATETAVRATQTPNPTETPLVATGTPTAPPIIPPETGNLGLKGEQSGCILEDGTVVPEED